MTFSEETKKLTRWIVTIAVGSLAIYYLVIEAAHVTEIIEKQGSWFAIGLFLMGELFFIIIFLHGAFHYKEELNANNEKGHFHWQFFGGLCASLALVAAAIFLLSWIFSLLPGPQSAPEEVEVQIRPPVERNALAGERIAEHIMR